VSPCFSLTIAPEYLEWDIGQRDNAFFGNGHSPRLLSIIQEIKAGKDIKDIKWDGEGCPLKEKCP
jgi:hypothetical protein